MRSKKFQELDNEGLREFVQGERGALNAEGTFEAESVEGGEKKKAGSLTYEWIRDILIAIMVAILVMQFIKPTIVKQRSMEPNFYTNDYLLVSKQAYGLFKGTPELGDVVIFETGLQTDNGTDKLLIKRVIGVPGDVVSIRGGKVYVNGQELDDSYTKDQYTSGEITDLVIPEHKLFCLGDNRAVSVDSRSDDVGLVDFDDIVGKAVFRVFPFSEFGRIDNPYED